jgi:endonuclease YncB( thermonuclease family)
MKQLAPASYTVLLDKVQKTLILGQRQIEEAKVLTYWKTGQLIDQHIRDHTPEGKERAAYNTQVVEKLTEDLKISDTVLYRCVRFAQQFKKVAARPLSWAHYRALIAVPDEKKRLALADQASKGEWSSRDLEIEIRNFLWGERVEKSNGKAPSLLPVPSLGPFWTYKILNPATTNGKLLIDLGFSCYRHLDAVTSKAFKSGDIVESLKAGDDSPGRVVQNSPGSARAIKAGGQYKLQKTDRSPDTLYVYGAQIEKIVDGDTLRVVVDLGFDTTTRQYIRLKGIDCPEIDTAEGKAAKRFVENILEGVDCLTIKSVKSDKYDRYLGDIFLPARSLKAPEGGTCAAERKRNDAKAVRLVYLNNLLIEKGHAVRVRE